jgi:hypothetical protein
VRWHQDAAAATTTRRPQTTHLKIQQRLPEMQLELAVGAAALVADLRARGVRNKTKPRSGWSVKGWLTGFLFLSASSPRLLMTSLAISGGFGSRSALPAKGLLLQ